MEMTIYPSLGETLYVEKLPNGASVMVLPKAGYNKFFACYSTNYGGADRRFKYGGEWIDTPAGVAHFLEHKMFDTKDGNALNILSANGASPNAWTSSAMTTYYFECAGGFEENLKSLLSFVSVPYFTQESVDKEQGIIGQEIRMTDDEPGYVVYFNLLKALYASTPARDSVAGSVESIAEISADTLYACHKVFYNPSNMVLCVAGDVSPERVVEIARSVLPAEPGEVPERDYGPADDKKVYAPVTEVQMSVSAPQFMFGCRVEPAPKGEGRLRQSVLSGLAVEYLTGRASPFYTELYSGGLIKNDFSACVDYAGGSAVLIAGGESRDPGAVLERFRAELAKLRDNGADPELFDRVKKSIYGANVRALDNFSGICTAMAESYFAGYNALDEFEILKGITAEELRGFILESFDPEGFALSVISPAEK